MGARETLLVKLADENGRAMEIYDPAQASKFLNEYVAAINRPAIAISAPSAVPRIGAIWSGQGGVYAGLCRGIGESPDYHLFVHADERDAISWQSAINWAKTLQADGHQNFALPTRKEQAVLFGNVPELFRKEWYWSCEQHAESSSYAWLQCFYDGYQSFSPKVNGCRARAVRRLVIR